MTRDADAARRARGSNAANTLDGSDITFAFMEFLDPTDSNAVKRRWVRYGFRDVTPMWGQKPVVPTFDRQRKIIDQWPQFQSACESLDAHWYYISGHHGRQFGVDGEGEDNRVHYNTQAEVGFFNHWYHEGTWKKASPAEPNKGERPLEVYMSSTTAPTSRPLGPRDNPLYLSPHPNCKGVLMISCNNLIYRQVRLAVHRFFPNAMVIAMLGKNSADAMPLINRFLRVCKKDFFKDPSTTDPKDLCAKLNPNPSARGIDILAVQYKGKVYAPNIKTKKISEIEYDRHI